MATTTLMPLDPALDPQRVTRMLDISADLLPPEIIEGRRARHARWIVLGALLAVLALLAGWYIYATLQVQRANGDLNEATTQVATLQQSQSRYQEVVDTQQQTKTIAKQLTSLLANDLPWSTLLSTLRDTGASSGVTVTGIIGTLDAAGTGTGGSKAGGSTTLPSKSGVTTVGTLTVTGTGPDKQSIAKYVDSLGALTTVANPYLTSATQLDTGVTFSITLEITSKALCGRFTTKCTSSGGK
jgi:Tfp pilus assembly protein PilN